MNRSTPAFFSTCIISIFIFSCLNIDRQEYRSVGFRIESGLNSQIVEKIQCGGTHYYLSPEGEKIHVTQEALGYYLIEGKKTTPINFLNNDNRHIFIPIQKSKYWIGAKLSYKKDDLEYIQNPKYVVELIVFSPSTGIKFKLPLDKYFALFPRGENKLYYQEKKTGQIFSCQPGLEEGLEVKQEDGPVDELFQTAIEHKIDFITSLSSFDLNQIIEESQKKLPNNRILIASTNTGKLWLKNMYPEIRDNFIFKTESPSVLIYDEHRFIQLPMLTTINNNTVWYYVHEPSEYLGSTTKLVSFNLKKSKYTP